MPTTALPAPQTMLSTVPLPSTALPEPPSLTVSIVSHGQLALIQPLLRQLDRWSHRTVAKVVLTINIPEPGEVDGLALRFPIERIDNTRPKGFGANHNAAFARCSTPWYLVLNPDIRLDDDIPTALMARAAPSTGLLAPRILEPGKSAPEAHRAIITPLEILARRRDTHAAPLVPDWIPGLFMLFRSTAYAELEGFDEKFFMYGEDFDICIRAQLIGWKLEVREDLKARHEAQRASHRSAKHLYWHLTSLVKNWISKPFWEYRAFRKYELPNNSSDK